MDGCAGGCVVLPSDGGLGGRSGMDLGLFVPLARLWLLQSISQLVAELSPPCSDMIGVYFVELIVAARICVLANRA